MKKLVFGLILASLGALQGCSAVMALSGEKEPNLSVITKGQSKAVVEAQPLKPFNVEKLSNGNTLATYQYTIGADPSAGRAAVYVLLDGVSLFISELITMPMEMKKKGETRLIKVEYSPNGEVVRVM